LHSEAWADLYLSSTDIEEAVADGKIELASGNLEDVAAVFDLFDRFEPSRNYKIPPLEY
jgi:hypothetical protein